MKPTIDAAGWRQRIEAARKRRDRNKPDWAEFATLHARSRLAVAHGHDAEQVLLPNGDQVTVGLIHRNVEQTLAVLDLPEIGVRAEAQDVTRELTAIDTHLESVVEAAVYESLMRSGMIRDEHVLGAVTLSAILFGHGVSYSYWAQETVEQDVAPVRIVQETADGGFEDVLDAHGGTQYEHGTETVTVWEGVRDEHVPVLEFLFDPAAAQIRTACWHGREQVLTLEVLRVDPRFGLPDGIVAQSFQPVDLYGGLVPQATHECAEADSVRLVTIWDRTHRELLWFLDAPQFEAHREPDGYEPDALLLIRAERWPFRLSLPGDSPFCAFVPMWAVDQPFGISQIQHVRNQGTEVDALRTRVANLTRQLKRVFGYDKNAIGSEQVDAALRSQDWALLGLDVQEGRRLSDLFSEFPMPQVHAELFRQIAQATQDVRDTTGVSDVPLGGAQTATESENLTRVGNARADRKRRLLLEYVARVGRVHKDLLAEFLPPGRMAQVPGDDGLPVLVPFGREAMQGSYLLTVEPSGGATAVSPVKQKMLMEAAQMFLGKFGPQFDLLLMRQTLPLMDLRGLSALQKAAAAGLGAAQPAPAPPGSGNPNEYLPQQVVRQGINALHE